MPAADKGDDDVRRARRADWEGWMRGMGRYTRRLRELVGLSQEQLARLAGVSQGAVSRLEAGRAVNTPMIAVMKINAAMRHALADLGAHELSAETRRLMDIPARGTPKTEAGFDQFPVTRDPLLTEFVRLFWQVPARHREGLVQVARAAADMLGGPPGRDTKKRDG